MEERKRGKKKKGSVSVVLVDLVLEKVTEAYGRRKNKG
jgi:hypothetical protein